MEKIIELLKDASINAMSEEKAQIKFNSTLKLLMKSHYTLDSGYRHPITHAFYLEAFSYGLDTLHGRSPKGCEFKFTSLALEDQKETPQESLDRKPGTMHRFSIINQTQNTTEAGQPLKQLKKTS